MISQLKREEAIRGINQDFFGIKGVSGGKLTWKPEYDLFRYKFLWGGRGSAKSTEMTGCLVKRGIVNAERIVCIREYENSLDESSKSLIDEWIDLLGYRAFFRTTSTGIYGVNGTRFLFKGLNDRTAQSLKSLNRYSIAYVEEGQVISDNSWNILVPTIRDDNSQIWSALNPTDPDDPIYKRSQTKAHDVYSRKVNWRDNKYFPSVLGAERVRMLSESPDLYDHIWEGDILSGDTTGKLFTPIKFDACIELSKQIDHSLFLGLNPHHGLDIATTKDGHNNGLASLYAGFIADVKYWGGCPLSYTASILPVDGTIYFDAIGVGNGLPSAKGLVAKVVGLSLSGSPFGKSRFFVHKYTNATTFANAYSQHAWALSVRANNTLEYLNGKNVPLEDCLIVNHTMSNNALGMLRKQFLAPSYKRFPKITVDKRMLEEGDKSPDVFDACVHAMHPDCRRGLTAELSPNDFYSSTAQVI